MAGITSTKVVCTEFGGAYKLSIATFTPLAASDVINITEVTHGVGTITAVLPFLTAGLDGSLFDIYATKSGLNVTVVTSAPPSTAASDWTGATARLLILGS